VSRAAGGTGEALPATVAVGPASTPEQERAIREQVEAEEQAAAARREAKLRAREGNG
jgi:hypothetical protein